jgi:opacity protein-like surface antigen
MKNKVLIKMQNISIFKSLRQALLITVIFSSTQLLAAGAGGGSHFSFLIGSNNANQSDLNGAIDDANAAVSGGITTKNLSSATEFSFDYGYRFSSTMFSMIIRPGYFTQSTTGSGTGGSYDYALSGFSFFPMLRLTPLENSFIKFFMQVGVGYGLLNGDVTVGTTDIKFSGSAFGFQSGLGAEFCFTPEHCMVIEGNYRYLPMERNTGDNSTSCSASGFSQCTGNNEIERGNKDIKTSMTGVLGSIGYVLRF